jgi:hypothetical protein
MKWLTPRISAALWRIGVKAVVRNSTDLKVAIRDAATGHRPTGVRKLIDFVFL